MLEPTHARAYGHLLKSFARLIEALWVKGLGFRSPVKELRPPHRNAAAISKSHLCISIDFACAGLHFEDGGAEAPAKEGGAVTTVTKHGTRAQKRTNV